MESRIQRIYLDTSVIGGYYDSEFEEDTRILFEKIKLEQFHVVLYRRGIAGSTRNGPKPFYRAIRLLTFDHQKKLFIMNTKKTVKKEAKEFDAVGFMRE